MARPVNPRRFHYVADGVDYRGEWFVVGDARKCIVTATRTSACPPERFTALAYQHLPPAPDGFTRGDVTDEVRAGGAAIRFTLFADPVTE